MKIIKKLSEDVCLEEAHGGSGKRKLYVSDEELSNKDFQAMTYGFLPPNSKFFLHYHDKMEEIMLVLKGTGIVRDEDGKYDYKPGDLFIYPPNIAHEIQNTGKEESEYIFVRIKV